MAEFGHRNDAQPAAPVAHDVRAETSFPDWGRLCESDTCRESYGRNTATLSKSAKL